MKTSSMPHFDRDIRDDELFSFIVQPGDIGDREDPEHCVFARCAKRHMRSDESWFGLCVGIIRIGDEMVRFEYTRKLYDAIHEFERTGVMKAGVYWTKTVRPSYRREARHAENRGEANGSRPASGKRLAWYAPRGWGRAAEPVRTGIVV